MIREASWIELCMTRRSSSCHFKMNFPRTCLGDKSGGVMVLRHRRWLRRVGLLAAAALASTFGLVGVGPAAVQAAEGFVPIGAVPLGAASSFGALTPNAAFTSTGGTTFRGDTGSTTYADAFAGLQAAYSDAAGRPAGTAMAGNISGETFGPGVHTSVGAVSTTAGLGFTIDAQGHPEAVFIFQINAALAFGAQTTVSLVNGAQAKNVFWQVNGG